MGNIRQENYIEIEGNKFYASQISTLSFDELKIIASFCSTERELSFLSHFSKNEKFETYVFNLIDNIKK